MSRLSLRVKGNVDRIKAHEGRRYHGASLWSVPAGPRGEALLRAYGAPVPGPEEYGEPQVPGPLWNYLMPFQREGVKWLWGKKTALLWDEQGLGKTVQAIAWACKDKEVVVVCPLNVMHQWVAEIDKAGVAQELRYTRTPSSFEAREAGRELLRPRWTVASYERCSTVNPDAPFTLIVDEYTFIKNPKTARTKAVLKLGEKASKILALTGHPMVNRPLDLWVLFQLLRERTLKEKWAWLQEYTGAYQTPYGWDFSGATHMDGLRSDLSAFSLRRTKAEVLPDLPPKRRVSIQLETKAEWKKKIDLAYREVVDQVLKGSPLDYGEGFGSTQRLRIECALSKVEAVAEWIKTHLENGGGKVVVFSGFKAPLAALQASLPPMVLLTGDIAPQKRPPILDSFKTPKYQVMGLTYDIGALGLNLQHADTVIILDLPWTPMALEQAEDRCHRYGQEHPVNVVTFRTDHPIEYKMENGLHYKQDLGMALQTAIRETLNI